MVIHLTLSQSEVVLITIHFIIIFLSIGSIWHSSISIAKAKVQQDYEDNSELLIPVYVSDANVHTLQISHTIPLEFDIKDRGLRRERALSFMLRELAEGVAKCCEVDEYEDIPRRSKILTMSVKIVR